MRLLILAAVILIAFAVIATATVTGTCLGVTWATWLCASLLAYFVDLLIGWTVSVPWVNRPAPPA